MDSLTQITLGAAMAETVAGRKIGNRALFWGSVGGTIPDLDVLGNAFLNEVDALAFHRGISHSFFFAFLAPIVLAFAADWLYKTKYHKAIAVGSIALLIGSLCLFLVLSKFNYITASLAILLAAGAFFFVRKRYFQRPYEPPNMDIKDWYILFFISIVTHPILDAFTVYGTQLFLPFSDYRVAFNTISVADPLYTIPFLLCVIATSFYTRTQTRRARINTLGIVLSSIYLLFTIGNKFFINSIVDKTIKEDNIEALRYMSGPTLLNNILWHTAIKSRDSIHFGQYSWFDREQKFKLSSLPIRENLIQTQGEDHTIKTLKWFSNNYYTVIPLSDGEVQMNDMRYGTFGDSKQNPEDYIFRFRLKKDNGSYHMLKGEGGPPKGRNPNELFIRLWSRIKGV